MFCLMDTVYLLPALPCPGMTWKPNWPLLPLLSVKPGAANPNGFLICGLYTINEPSPPSQTETMDQHFPVCVCVRSLPLFLLTFPNCLPLWNRSVHWHVFIILSLSALLAWCVALQPLRFSTLSLFFPSAAWETAGVNRDERGVQLSPWSSASLLPTGVSSSLL